MLVSPKTATRQGRQYEKQYCDTFQHVHNRSVWLTDSVWVSYKTLRQHAELHFYTRSTELCCARVTT